MVIADADLSQLLYVFSLCSNIVPAAHFVLTSTTIAVITSAVINLRIIAESLNPQKNTIIAKASRFSIHSFTGCSHDLFSAVNTRQSYTLFFPKIRD